MRDVPAYFMHTIPTGPSLLSIIFFFREQSVFAISGIREHTLSGEFSERMNDQNDAKLRREKTKGKTTDMKDEEGDTWIGERYGLVELRSSCTEITDAACFMLERKCLEEHSTSIREHTRDRIEETGIPLRGLSELLLVGQMLVSKHTAKRNAFVC